MAKGKKTGGRKKGTPNKVTDSIKSLLNSVLPEAELKTQWEYFLAHEDVQIRFESFKLANHYLFGKPVQIVAGSEELPPVHIDISAIPRNRERA